MHNSEHPITVNACRPKSYGKYFKTKVKTGIKLENGLMVKDGTEIETIKNLIKNDLKSDGNRIC